MIDKHQFEQFFKLNIHRYGFDFSLTKSSVPKTRN